MSRCEKFQTYVYASRTHTDVEHTPGADLVKEIGALTLASMQRSHEPLETSSPWTSRDPLCVVARPRRSHDKALLLQALWLS